MTDLNKLWQEISEQSESLQPMEKPDFQPTAQNVLATIRTRTRWKLYFIYFFLAVYLTVFIWFDNWESRAIFGAMMLFGLVNLWLVLRFYLQMKKPDLLMSGSSRTVLQFYHDHLAEMLRQENLMGAWTTPFAAMLGFMWAFVEKTGSAAEVFSNWKFLLVMLATGLVLAPLGAWTTKWMNKVAFGNYLDYLKNSLGNLKEE